MPRVLWETGSRLTESDWRGMGRIELYHSEQVSVEEPFPLNSRLCSLGLPNHCTNSKDKNKGYARGEKKTHYITFVFVKLGTSSIADKKYNIMGKKNTNNPHQAIGVSGKLFQLGNRYSTKL